MKHAVPLLALTAVLASSACLNERLYFEPGAGGGDLYGIQKGVSSPGYSSGALVGDLGPIRDVNDDRASVIGSSDEEFDYSTVQVTGAGSSGTGFVILDLYSMNLKDAPAGTYDSNAETGDIGVTVCSDSHDGSVHFDAMAEDATIVIEDINPDTREVTIDSTVSDGGLLSEPTTQRASFRIER